MTNEAHDGFSGQSIDLLLDDPIALWANLRANCPVTPAEGISPAGQPTYFVSTWAEADAVLRDTETFSSSINGEGTGKFMGPNMLSMDGERHRAHRLLVSYAFRASQLVKWEHSLMRPAIDRLCDGVVAQGKAELMSEVISRYPVLVICGLCDIPAQDSPKFLQWAIDIHRGMRDPAVGEAAASAMQAYLEPIVARRRANPGDDLISDIVTAEVDGHRLDDEEVFGFLRLLLPAGSESTFRTMGSALLAILTTPGLLDRVLADRALLAAVVEETIRWDASNSMVNRIATRDTVLAGCPIPAGSSVLVFTGSANRDQAHFTDPDRFDPDRQTARHMSFGTGPHQCLGMHLARIELRAGLDVILDRLANLRLDPAWPTPVIEGFTFRGPAELHVLFDPA